MQSDTGDIWIAWPCPATFTVVIRCFQGTIRLPICSKRYATTPLLCDGFGVSFSPRLILKPSNFLSSLGPFSIPINEVIELGWNPNPMTMEEVDLRNDFQRLNNAPHSNEGGILEGMTSKKIWVSWNPREDRWQVRYYWEGKLITHQSWVVNGQKYTFFRDKKMWADELTGHIRSLMKPNVDGICTFHPSLIRTGKNESY